jgi:hypothetical protein
MRIAINNRRPTAALRSLSTWLALAALALATLAPAPAAAGPWVKAPGKSYLKISGSTFSSDQMFDLSGNLVDTGFTASHTALRVYGEVGIYPSVALNFGTAFYSSTNELNERTRYNRWGPGDLDFNVQVALMSGGACVASVAPGVRLPLYEGTVSAESGVSAVDMGSAGIQRYTPALGDGSVDLVAVGAFGCSLYPVPGWFGVQAGPRIRLNGFGDGVNYAADAGIFVWPERLALTVRAGGIQALTSDNERPTKSYLTVGGGVILNIYAGFALEATASYIPFGEFVSKGWNAGIGLSYTGSVFANPYD